MAFYLIPYTNFDGQTEEAFDLYQKAFNDVIQIKH